jgi:hypothetical protein
MKAMRQSSCLLLPLLLLAGCEDQPVANGYGSTTPRYERPIESKSNLESAVVAVRIGELGRNFAACNAQGEVRERATNGAMPVRAAPFEQAQQKGQLPPGSTFFICSRSIDQRWLGIVYQANGRAERACGVSSPISARRDYEGPCDSGWVASAQVRLISGVQEPPVQASENVAQAK